jgi:1,4-dihydroxy-2-naphthoate octaprenyltransferase
MATAILVVNNLRDRDGDRRAAKHTLVVRFGARFGRAEYLGLVVAAYLLVVACASWHGRMALLAPLATLPFAARQIARVMTRDGVALNLELARTAQLGFAFNLLLALGVLR